MHCVKLIRHPAAHAVHVHHIDAQVSVLRTAILQIQYLLGGDVAQLRMPADTAPRRADNLWQHTCFEAFISAANISRYCELNFAPSGEWAAYRFDAYRLGMTPIEIAPPIITTRREKNTLILDVSVDLTTILAIREYSALRLALSAVIEQSDCALSYWALAHPPGKPDFHHPDNFALTLNSLKNSP